MKDKIGKKDINEVKVKQSKSYNHETKYNSIKINNTNKNYTNQNDKNNSNNLYNTKNKIDSEDNKLIKNEYSNIYNNKKRKNESKTNSLNKVCPTKNKSYYKYKYKNSSKSDTMKQSDCSSNNKDNPKENKKRNNNSIEQIKFRDKINNIRNNTNTNTDININNTNTIINNINNDNSNIVNNNSNNINDINISRKENKVVMSNIKNEEKITNSNKNLSSFSKSLTKVSLNQSKNKTKKESNEEQNTIIPEKKQNSSDKKVNNDNETIFNNKMSENKDLKLMVNNDTNVDTKINNDTIEATLQTKTNADMENMNIISSNDNNMIKLNNNSIMKKSKSKIELKPKLRIDSRDLSDNQKKLRDKNNVSASSYYSTNTSVSSSSSLSSYSKTLNKTQLEIHKRFKKMKEKTNINTNTNNLDNNNDSHMKKTVNDKKYGVVNLTICTLTGRQFPIKVLSSYTVGDIKDLIQDKEGISSRNQILIYQDKTLDCDSLTLEDYGIDDGASLKLIIKLFDGLCNIEQTDNSKDNTVLLLLCKKKGYLYLFETSLKSSSHLSTESFDSSLFDFCNSIDDKSESSSELSSQPSTPLSSTYSNSSLSNKDSLNYNNSQISKSGLESTNDDDNKKSNKNNNNKNNFCYNNSHRSLSINFDILKMIENATMRANKSGYNVTVAIQDFDSPVYSYQSSINSFSDDDSSDDTYQNGDYKTDSSYQNESRYNSKSSANINTSNNSHINSKQTSSVSLDSRIEYILNNNSEKSFYIPMLEYNSYSLYKNNNSTLRRAKSEIFNFKKSENNNNSSLTIKKQKSDSQLFNKNFHENYNKTCQNKFYDQINNSSKSIICPFYFIVKSKDSMISNNNKNNNNIASNNIAIKEKDNQCLKKGSISKKVYSNKLISFISSQSSYISILNSDIKNQHNIKFSNNNNDKNVNVKLLSKSYSQIFSSQFLDNKVNNNSKIDGNLINSKLINKLYSERPITSIPIVTNYNSIFKSYNNNNIININKKSNEYINNNENLKINSNITTNDTLNNKMVSYKKQNIDNSLKENNILAKNTYNKIITPRIIKSSYDIYGDINQKSPIHKKDKNIIKSHIIKSSFSIYDGLTPLDHTFSNRNKTRLKVKNRILQKYKNISSLPEMSIKKNQHDSKENKFSPTENICKLPDIYHSNSVPNNHIYKPQITIQLKESILDDNIDRYIAEDNQNYCINDDKNSNSKNVKKLESQIYYKRRSPNCSKYDSKEMFPDTNTIMKKIESEYSINDYSDEEDNIALDFYYQNPVYDNEIKENSIQDYVYDTDNFIKNYKIPFSFQKEYSKNDDNCTDEYILFNEEKDIPVNKIKSFISTKSLKNVNSLDKKLDLSLKKKYENENENENILTQEVKTFNSDTNNKYTNDNNIKNTEENGNNSIMKKNKCEFCNKKLRITATYKCKCGKIFCAAHRYSECHNCTYDYKKQGKKDLEKNNPLVVKDKLQKC